MPSVAARSGKRRKRKHHAGARTATPKTATSHHHFEKLPKEVMANIANCLDRTGINNLRLMNKKIKDTVDDPGFVVKPWPSKCPTIHKATNNRPLYFLVYSQCGNRLAVGLRDMIGCLHDFNIAVTIWDRVLGLVGELECQPNGPLRKPVFSPDGDTLFCFTTNRADQAEAVIFQLPKVNQRGPVFFSTSDIVNVSGRISDAAFLSNNTIIFTDDSAIKKCRLVTGTNGRLTCTNSESIIDTEHELAGFTKVASSDERKGLFAYANPGTSVHIYDVRSGVAVTKNVPGRPRGMTELAFSHDGKYLVVRQNEGNFSVFDCDVNQIEDIAPHKKFPGFRHVKGFSFLPYSTKILAAVNGGFRVFDIETGKVVPKGKSPGSSGWNGRWWDTFSKVVYEENLRALASR